MAKAYVQRDTAVTGKYYVETEGGGGGGVSVIAPDGSNVIQASTPIYAQTTITYTATEDCAIYFFVHSQNSESWVTLDGVRVWTLNSYNANSEGRLIYVKKGTEVKIRNSHAGTQGNYTVYGIK